MSSILAWAADVVGGAATDDDYTNIQIPIEIAFSREQQQHALNLDQKASSLRKSINELKSRIPPAHIWQRLPHLHARTIASNADLALQLNAHSTTKEQAQLREITLQEENVAYEKAISNCETKIQEARQEADLLEAKLKEMDLVEKNLKTILEKELKGMESIQSSLQTNGSNNIKDSHLEKDLNNDKRQELEEKKKEMSSMEEKVRKLEEAWLVVQEESISQPSTAQREKLLEKQLHSLVEQLTAKQAQAEGLMEEIRAKEREVQRLNGLRRRNDDTSVDASSVSRNRFSRGNLTSFGGADYSSDVFSRRLGGGKTDEQQRLMLFRSAFIIYILILHVIVFIKISF